MAERREGGDIFFQDFIREEIAEGHLEVSEIQDFFDGATVFITGGTGFLGQTLIEKLLRSTKVKRIYALIRAKGMKSASERLSEVLDGVLFTTVALQRHDFRSSVAVVFGDCCLPDLGITSADKELLKKEVDIVIHTAGTGQSTQNLRTALLVNVRATELLLNLTKQMRHVKSFIYVSSSYINYRVATIEEKIYPADLNFKKLLALLDILDDNNLRLLQANLICGWPDVATFSRHVAEDLVGQEPRLPVGIIRLSTLVSTAFEPLVGWVDRAKGPQALVFNALSGIMKVLYANKHYKADVVPVDLAANAVLAFAWDIGNMRGDGPNVENLPLLDIESTYPDRIPVLNFVMGKYSITWDHFLQLCFMYGITIPMLSDASSVPNLSMYSNYRLAHLNQLVFHYIPAVIFDIFLYVTGYTPRWISTYRQLHYDLHNLSLVTTRQVKFHDRNTKLLWKRLSLKDRLLFNFDQASIDWNEYMKMYVRGIRAYLGKEDMNTLPAARKRMHRLKMIYYAGKVLLGIGFLASLNLFYWSFLRD